MSKVLRIAPIVLGDRDYKRLKYRGNLNELVSNLLKNWLTISATPKPKEDENE